MACYLLQSLKALLKDSMLATGEKESRFLRTREYLYSELRRRKDQTNRIESSMVIDHRPTLRFHNMERFRAINFVPIR